MTPKEEAITALIIALHREVQDMRRAEAKAQQCKEAAYTILDRIDQIALSMPPASPAAEG